MDRHKINTIAVYGSHATMRLTDDVTALLTALAEHGVDLYIEAPLWEALQLAGIPEGYPQMRLGGETPYGDIALSLGGDGTLLRAVHKLRDVELAIWAINCGHLGFMTEMEPQEALHHLDDLLAGQYDIETRSLIDVSVAGEHVGTALNDLAVQKRETGSIIKIRVDLDGNLLAEYAADGLVVSTPSGSTAYALSLGGPIVTPQCQTLLLVPIAPHTLNMAPLIFPDTSVLTMRVSSLHPTFSIVIDGNLRVYDCGVEIVARKSDKRAHLLRLSHKPYAQVIREKLLWGRDLR